jgi:dUTP pyrophosphatase
MDTATFLLRIIDDTDKELYKNHGNYYEEDSGLDLFTVSDVEIPPNSTKIIGLGVCCQLQNKDTGKYYSYNVYPRSSISKTPLLLANSVGLADSGYTGELKMALHNTSNLPFKIFRGERYVQLVKGDLSNISMEIVETLRNTIRSSNGLGSTLK